MPNLFHSIAPAKHSNAKTVAVSTSCEAKVEPGLMNEIKPAAEVVKEIWKEFLSAKNELQNLSV